MGKLQNERRNRLQEMRNWAKRQSTAGLEERLFNYAKANWFVSDATAQDYAGTIILTIKADQKGAR